MVSLAAQWSFGVDIQGPWAAISCWEGDPLSAVEDVGDGVRTQIPTLADDHGWGSGARRAPEVIDREPMAGLGSSRFVGSPEPISMAFLAGLARRIEDFTGQTGTFERAPLFLCLVDSSSDGTLGDDAIRTQLASLGPVYRVDPTEAVVADWLMGGMRGRPLDESFVGTVQVVASGETSTTIALFEVDLNGVPSIRQVPGSNRRLVHGVGVVRLRVVNEVLRLRRQPDQPVWTVPLLAAAGEFGQVVASRGGAAGWDGPLADDLHTELRLTQEDIDEFEEMKKLTTGLRSALSDSARLHTGDRPKLVLLGGPGAAWPSLERSLRPRDVVVSATPASSISAGSSYWPALSRWFDPARQGPLEVRTRGRGQGEERPLAPSTTTKDEVPPWMRP